MENLKKDTSEQENLNKDSPAKETSEKGQFEEQKHQHLALFYLSWRWRGFALAQNHDAVRLMMTPRVSLPIASH